MGELPRTSANRVRHFLIILFGAGLLMAAKECLWGRFSVISCVHAMLGAIGRPPDQKVDADLVAWMAKGNTAIICRNADPALASTVTYMYFRGSYVGYPNRIFVAPPGVVVNEVDDFFGLGWVPSPLFVQRHDIHTLLHFRVDAKGCVQFRETDANTLNP